MKVGVPVLALACVLVALPAAAVDRVVDDKGVACLSGRPLHTTIGGAVAAAAPGETILVCAGTYNENVIVTKADLTLQGQGGPRLRPGNASLHGFDVVANGVTIKGLDISGFSGSQLTCGIRVFADGADINDNQVHANSSGICVLDGSDHRVRYNVVQDNAGGGIVVHGPDGPVEVSNNTVKNGTVGISAGSCVVPGSGVVIDHNAVTGSKFGLIVGGDRSNCLDAVVSNNTVRGPGASTQDSFGLFVFSGHGGVYTRNSFQDVQAGMHLDQCNGCTASFNSVSFSDVGLDLLNTDGATVTRNNVSRSTTVDCRWDSGGVNVLVNNNCGTQSPPGAFD